MPCIRLAILATSLSKMSRIVERYSTSQSAREFTPPLVWRARALHNLPHPDSRWVFSRLARNPIEQAVASKRGWDESTRLACQTRVHGDVVIRRLLDNPQDIVVLDLDELHGVLLEKDVLMAETNCAKWW